VKHIKQADVRKSFQINKALRIAGIEYDFSLYLPGENRLDRRFCGIGMGRPNNADSMKNEFFTLHLPSCGVDSGRPLNYNILSFLKRFKIYLIYLSNPFAALHRSTNRRL
jgi:hypothetical protein